MIAPRLPEAFEYLIPFISWALPTERERHFKRIGSTIEELREFYAQMMSRADEVMGFLKTVQVADMNSEARTLLYLALSLAEVSSAVEQYHQPVVPDSFDTHRFRFHQ